MEANEERVAPWYVDGEEGRRAVTTATDWAVSRRSSRRRWRVSSVDVWRHRRESLSMVRVIVDGAC